MSWVSQGLCHQICAENADLRDAFYADKVVDRKPAQSVCRNCPVRLTCLQDALERNEIWGVWGGCDEVELRRALWIDTNGVERTRMKFPRCPACMSRIENLRVTYRNDDEQVVQCTSCEFSWAAASSIKAVHTYQTMVKVQGTNVTQLVPGTGKKTRASRTVRARIPQSSPVPTRLGSPSVTAVRAHMAALAASGEIPKQG